MKKFHKLLSVIFGVVLYTGAASATFQVTTTPDTTQFNFKISAAGTFTIDCGTDGTLNVPSTFTRSGTGYTQYTCTYPTPRRTDNNI